MPGPHMPQKSIRTRGSWCVALIFLVAMAGCNVTIPSLRHPGHLYTQQLRATYHDPYGQPDVAPAIEGGRPEGYERPRAVPVQAQWFN